MSRSGSGLLVRNGGRIGCVDLKPGFVRVARLGFCDGVEPGALGGVDGPCGHGTRAADSTSRRFHCLDPWLAAESPGLS